MYLQTLSKSSLPSLKLLPDSFLSSMNMSSYIFLLLKQSGFTAGFEVSDNIFVERETLRTNKIFSDFVMAYQIQSSTNQNIFLSNKLLRTFTAGFEELSASTTTTSEGLSLIEGPSKASVMLP